MEQKRRPYESYDNWQKRINSSSQAFYERKTNQIKNIVGWVGVLFILSAYVLLTFNIIEHQTPIYHLLNLFGGTLLCWRVYQDKNYANVFLEIVFILIAVIGLIKNI